MLPLETIIAKAGKGLKRLNISDRPLAERKDSRQATLIQDKHLSAVASFLRCGAIDPHSVCRNIMAEEFIPSAMKSKCFAAGDALFNKAASVIPTRAWKKTLVSMDILHCTDSLTPPYPFSLRLGGPPNRRQKQNLQQQTQRQYPMRDSRKQFRMRPHVNIGWRDCYRQRA